MTSIDKIYGLFRRLSPLVILVVANVAVFVVLRIIAIIVRFVDMPNGVDAMVNSLLLPHTFSEWIYVPWTALTYMFVQYEPLHLLMNMLWLYMFGNILDKVVSRRQFFSIYLAGGIVGALSYLAVGSMIGATSAGLTGASASILAVMASAVVLMPALQLRLFLIGEASLKVVVLIAVVLVVLATGVGNYSVHAAHIGGFLAGVVAVCVIRHKLFFVGKSMRKPQSSKAESEAALDELLDKIRRSGFNSLTSSERVRLIKISSNLQKHSNETQR